MTAYSNQQTLYGSGDVSASNCNYSQSESFTDSPLYRAESWERVHDHGVEHSQQSVTYHSSPRTAKRLVNPTKPAKCSCCRDYRSSDMCISMRLKCLVWKTLCCVNFKKNGCSCKLGRIYRQYFFFSKSLIVVLLINALFSTALYGVTSEVLKIVIGSEYILTRTFVIHGITQIMFPIAGHLADLYIGRHNMIQFSLWLAWIGFAFLGMAFSFDDYNNHISSMNRFVILPITILLLSVSYVCFMSNLIPFGLDQLQGASHIHHSSFFYWWYWTLNVGIIFVNMPQYCQYNIEIDILIQAEIGLVCITMAIALDALLKHWFVIEPICKENNPLVQIAAILKEAFKRSKPQRIPSVVFHEINIQRFSRMDRIKKRYGGKYETEEVEDVKTFFRMIIILIGVGFSTLIYAGVFDTIGLMASNMKGTLAHLSIRMDLCQVDITLMDGINAALLLVFIPILDLFIVPLLRHSLFNPSILKRLGLGSFLAFVTVFLMFIIQAVGDQTGRVMTCMFNDYEPHGAVLDVDVYWLLVPILIGTITEVFIYIPGFEFICAQAPCNMRGLLIGIFFSMQGAFSLISLLLQYLFMENQLLQNIKVFTGLSCGSWYYLILLSLALFGLLFYVVASWKYKRRKRDDVFNEVTLIEEYYTSILRRTNSA